jgi:hypothetical protein
MNQTTWLLGRRMQKFRDILSRWERKELSAMEAGELLGCSERQFRRYRRRYEEEGLAGLADRRLKARRRYVGCRWTSWCGCSANTARITWAGRRRRLRRRKTICLVYPDSIGLRKVACQNENKRFL